MSNKTERLLHLVERQVIGIRLVSVQNLLPPKHDIVRARVDQASDIIAATG